MTKKILGFFGHPKFQSDNVRFWGLLRIGPSTRIIDSESEFLRAEGLDSVRQGGFIGQQWAGGLAGQGEQHTTAPHNFRSSHNFPLFFRE